MLARSMFPVRMFVMDMKCRCKPFRAIVLVAVSFIICLICMSDLAIDFLIPSNDIDRINDGRPREYSSSIMFIEPGSPEALYNGQQRDINKKNHYRTQVRRKHIKRQKRTLYFVNSIS